MSELLYGSSGDVRLELGSPDEVEVSASLINTSRQKATRLINTYCKNAYPDNIPFATAADIPLVLDSLANDLSVYFVKRSLHHGPSPLSDEIKIEYYENSIKLLEEIRDGKTVISELDDAQGTSIDTNRSGYIPIFDVDGELEQKVDSDLSDDIADERN